MGLFGPKLTGEQKGFLRTVANTMNVLADRQKFFRTHITLGEGAFLTQNVCRTNCGLIDSLSPTVPENPYYEGRHQNGKDKSN